MEERCQESVLLIPQFAHLSTRENTDCNLQIISHNVEGLGSNFRLITCDQVYLSPDVILLNETWTDPTDCSEIPGFCMLSTADRSGSNEKTGARCYISQNVLRRFEPSQIVSYNRTFRQGAHTVSVAIVSLERDIYCSMYVSPQPTQQILLESFSFIFALPFDRIVIGGDFNVDFGTASFTSDLIMRTMNEHGLRSCLPESVNSTTRLNTFIDNLFTNGETYISYTCYHEPMWVVMET